MNEQRINDVLRRLPAFAGRQEVISADQSVHDIIAEVLESHEIFTGDYDAIIDCFYYPGINLDAFYNDLFLFCKNNLRYEAEPGRYQTTRSPAGILTIAKMGGSCDCKHYAGFIGGLLNAAQRKGAPIDWRYRFASYNSDTDIPGHVFVVIKQDPEIWLDPAPIIKKGTITGRAFNDRYVRPVSFKDKTVMALVRLSGFTESGFSNVNVVSRKELHAGPGAMPIIAVPNLGAIITPQIDTALMLNPVSPTATLTPDTTPLQATATANALPQAPAVPLAETISYTVDGQPYLFPEGKADPNTMPQTLAIVYPATWQGHAVPVAMPKPLIVGNRIILLPKGDWSFLTNDVGYGSWYWMQFLELALQPLLNSFSQTPWKYINAGLQNTSRNPSGAQLDLANTIKYDADNVDVTDYVTGRATVIPTNYRLPAGVQFLVGGAELKLPPDNTAGTVPPPLPDFTTIYPASWNGVAIPADLPRPVNNGGKLQFNPAREDRAVMAANNSLLATFLTNVMAPLINSYSQYPYANNDNTGSKLADRVWWDLVDGNPKVDNYLIPVDVKTAAGAAIQKVGQVVQDVGLLIVKFIGIIPRTAYLSLVRFNVFDMGAQLGKHIATTDGETEVKDKWHSLGGTWGDLHSAILSGQDKKQILGINDNTYLPAVGQTGAEVAAWVATAAPVIAAMAALIKKIAPPGSEAAKAVDSAVTAVNGILTAAGQDPIKLAADINKPAIVTDPATGKTYTVTPPTVSANLLDSAKQFVTANPVLAVGGAAAIIWGGSQLFKSKKRRHA